MSAYPSHHNPDRITWDIARTNWLNEVPLALGTIPSSREGHPDHNVCVRAGAFWAAWAREQDGDTLIREGRELAYAATFWGTEAWQRMKLDAIGDEVGYRMAFTEAA
jgi:hypothetical protein